MRGSPPKGRPALILDGLCLHVLSSFQRTGWPFRTAAPFATFVLRGTFQIYDDGNDRVNYFFHFRTSRQRISRSVTTAIDAQA